MYEDFARGRDLAHNTCLDNIGYGVAAFDGNVLIDGNGHIYNKVEPHLPHLYIIYLSDLVRGSKKKEMLFQTGKKKLAGRGVPAIEMVLGIIILLVSGNWLVKIGAVMARDWGVPVGVVGLLIISVGTSLPELFLSAGAIMKRNVALVLGNVLGSVVTNATLIIGVLAFFHPFSIERTGGYALVNMAFVIIFGLFWMFTSSKRKLERREGLILVGVFVTFVGLVLLFPSI